MKKLLSLVVAALAPAGLASSQSMYITSCSIGCSSGQQGPVSCTTIHIHENADFRLEFSEDVELSSVNSSTLRIVNVANGTVPFGQFFLDCTSPRTLIFRPDVTFTPNGPEFGFEPNTAYQITVPGNAQDPPPYVESTSGDPNRSRMQCTVLTSLGQLPAAQSYCTSSPNTAGPGAFMGASGTTSVVGNDLVLTTTGAVPNQFGLYFYGLCDALVPIGNGVVCVGSPQYRLHPVVTIDASGVALRPIDYGNIPQGAPVVSAGATWYFQLWYRDPTAQGSTFNFSDGLRVLFHP